RAPAPVRSDETGSPTRRPSTARVPRGGGHGRRRAGTVTLSGGGAGAARGKQTPTGFEARQADLRRSPRGQPLRPGGRAAAGPAAAGAGSVTAGSRSVNRLPRPGSLSTVTVPPKARAMRRTTASPRPTPPGPKPRDPAGR